MKQDITIKIDAHRIPQGFGILGVIFGTNGCCEDKPYLITVNKCRDGKPNYSCQCACGLWCTTGHEKPEEAAYDYENMAKQAAEEERWRRQEEKRRSKWD